MHENRSVKAQSKRFSDSRVTIGKLFQANEIPNNIPEKIEQIRQCTRLHDEINPTQKGDKKSVPPECYKPAELKLNLQTSE